MDSSILLSLAAIVTAILGAFKLGEWLFGCKRNGNKANGYNGIFSQSDRKALHDVAHAVSSDSWSTDLHDLLKVARASNNLLLRMLERDEAFQKRMEEHFGRMECMRPPQ